MDYESFLFNFNLLQQNTIIVFVSVAINIEHWNYD